MSRIAPGTEDTVLYPLTANLATLTETGLVRGHHGSQE